MDQAMKEIILIIKNKEKGNFIGMIRHIMMDNLKTINLMDLLYY